MSAADIAHKLIVRVGDHGGRLRLNNGTVHYNGPRPPKDLLADLKAHRAELLAYLAAAPPVLSGGEVLGVSVRADGSELVLRYQGRLPAELVDELRTHKAEVLAFLEGEVDDSPAVCRGCAALIPPGTTLCVECGSARSPLVKYALELCALSEERSLRGRALAALDKRRYPRLQLRKGRTVGPGLLAWCPVLRDGNADTFRRILELVDSVPPGGAD